MDGCSEIANVSNLKNTLCNSFPFEYISFISDPPYIIQTHHGNARAEGWCGGRIMMVLVDSKMLILAATILTTIHLSPFY